MKRGWMIILLLSLGMNVGLGLNLLRRPSPPASPPVPALAPGAAEDAPDPDQVERFMRHRLDRMSQKLNLDEGQRTALWHLHRDVGSDVFHRRRAMTDARSQLHEAYASTDADPAAIHAAVRRISATQSYLDSTIVEVMLQERAILTPQQRLHYHELFPISPQRHPRRLLSGPRRGLREGRRQAQ